VELTDEEKP